MTSEPSQEERERAARIRRLRRGGAASRSFRRRQRRQTTGPDDEPAEGAGDDGTEDGPDEGAGDDGTDGGTAGQEATDAAGGGPGDQETAGIGLAEAEEAAAEEDVDEVVVELPADAPADLDLVVVPVREGLRRELNRIGEQLHLRYGFEYKRELDPEVHVRPLVVYAGIEALEGRDVEEIKRLVEGTDLVDAPGPPDDAAEPD